ncbi:translation initiation factor eIF4E 4F complex subunit [Schizosaccharomyces octosporus yFS286]|uniref:Translation initiation factor eIF4E 4F complex subunit n=1 Tax=Schizosaccharomyces octosporus (strain yFS286) TaxID=483514 RepID=S9RJV4_SCHOY|nr:translation initiation factor eIF4E 4F complex subunit [Schizosaccharomyces octosporus yFS286]EPX74254.1 translation initiation factor eIF4E 4F complex subunit [Schizosaccharomyces octosporus yFS286]
MTSSGEGHNDIAAMNQKFASLDVSDTPKVKTEREGRPTRLLEGLQFVNAETAFTQTHPFQHEWTLWFLKPPTQGLEWGDLLKEIISFKTVEEFWGIFKTIAKASMLPAKSDYSFFLKGIRPEWEDPNNMNGGKWAFQSKHKGSNLDELWLYMVLAALGETLDPTGKEVTGVVCNMRRGFYRIAVWTRNCNDREVLEKIGLRFKEILGVSEKETIEYSAHEDSSKAGSMRAKTRMSL